MQTLKKVFVVLMCVDVVSLCRCLFVEVGDIVDVVAATCFLCYELQLLETAAVSFVCCVFWLVLVLCYWCLF